MRAMHLSGRRRAKKQMDAGMSGAHLVDRADVGLSVTERGAYALIEAERLRRRRATTTRPLPSRTNDAGSGFAIAARSDVALIVWPAFRCSVRTSRSENVPPERV